MTVGVARVLLQWPCTTVTTAVLLLNALAQIDVFERWEASGYERGLGGVVFAVRAVGSVLQLPAERVLSVVGFRDQSITTSVVVAVLTVAVAAAADFVVRALLGKVAPKTRRNT